MFSSFFLLLFLLYLLTSLLSSLGLVFAGDNSFVESYSRWVEDVLILPQEYVRMRMSADE